MESEFVLPKEVEKADVNKPPRDLVIVSQPKMGKSTLLGALTRDKNGIVFNLEKGGYEYISARKLSIHKDELTNEAQAFSNYIKIRKLLLENKGEYDYLVIDGLSDLDALSEIGGTLAYMNTIAGKNFNLKDKKRPELGKWKLGDPEFKMVTSIPEGYGYKHTRAWFLEQIRIFRQISPYRLYAAHIADKFIKSDNGKNEVSGHEIFLTGKLKTIFPSKVSSLCKLIAEDNVRLLNFDVLNDSLIAGSRAPKLKGQIKISESDDEGNVETFWDSIY